MRTIGTKIHTCVKMLEWLKCTCTPELDILESALKKAQVIA